MTLREEIDAIRGDASLDYGQKVDKLRKLITQPEIDALLKQQADVPTLKEPLNPKTRGMRTLHLALKPVFYNEILKGMKKIEYRDYKDYYINKCTYEEGGKRYIVPYDALVFYDGNKRSMTVALKDIKCNGQYFLFYLGDILYSGG